MPAPPKLQKGRGKQQLFHKEVAALQESFTVGVLRTPRPPPLAGGRSRLRFAARAALKTGLLSSAPLRPSPQRQGSRTPLRCAATPLRCAAASSSGGLANHRTPGPGRRAATKSLTRAPVYLWHHAALPVLDKRPRFGIITRCFLLTGLLWTPQGVIDHAGAPFTWCTSPTFLEAFASER